MAAAAVDLAQAQARVTEVLDPSTPAPGLRTRPGPVSADTWANLLPSSPTFADMWTSPLPRGPAPQSPNQVKETIALPGVGSRGCPAFLAPPQHPQDLPVSLHVWPHFAFPKAIRNLSSRMLREPRMLEDAATPPTARRAGPGTQQMRQHRCQPGRSHPSEAAAHPTQDTVGDPPC